MRRAVFVALSFALAGCWLALDDDYTRGSADAGATSSSSGDANATLNDASSPTDALADAAEAGPAPPSYAATVRADGPSFYFHFDEDDDTKFTDEIAGRTLNPDSRDAVDTGEPGAVKGHAIKLDGTDGLVLVGTVDWSAGKLFAFEMFIRPTATDENYRRILEKITLASGGPVNGTYLWINAGSTTVGFERWKDKAGVDAAYWHVTPPADAFTHVVVSVDGVTTQMYANGALVASSSNVDPRAANDPNVPFRVGSNFAGWVDELAYYEKPLTAAQVKAHYDAALRDKP